MTHRLLSKQSAAHTEQSHGTNTRTNTHKIIYNKHLKEHTRKTLTRRHASECDALAIARAVSGAQYTVPLHTHAHTHAPTHANSHPNILRSIPEKHSQAGTPARVTHRPLPEQSAAHTARSQSVPLKPVEHTQ